MKETVEELLSKYKKKRDEAIKAVVAMDEIIEEITSASDDAFDWVSVRTAAKRLDVSPQYLYTRKDLEQKHIGSKIYLRWSQCKAIDDKYASS